MSTIPSLSELGWVTDSQTALAKLLSYYMLTDYNQSIAFKGNLTSLSKAYQEYINDPDNMSTTIRRDLSRLLERHFEKSEVIVRIKEEDKGLVTLMIYAYAIGKDGVKANLGHVISMDAEGLKKTIEINNEGAGEAFLGD